MKIDTNTAPTFNSQLDAIETATLDDVTGGCAACGQNCANGPAPTAAGAQPWGSQRPNAVGAR